MDGPKSQNHNEFHDNIFCLDPEATATLLGQAQPVQDLHRITDAVSRYHVEYHKLEVPKGKEAVLADLKPFSQRARFVLANDGSRDYSQTTSPTTKQNAAPRPVWSRPRAGWPLTPAGG